MGLDEVETDSSFAQLRVLDSSKLEEESISGI